MDTIQKDYSAERLVRCMPVAQEVLEMIADASLPTGILTDAQVDEAYKGITLKVMALFLERDLNYTDRNFIFQLVAQVTDNVASNVTTNLQARFHLSSDKVWGKDINDLKLIDIDGVLQRDTTIPKA